MMNSCSLPTYTMEAKWTVRPAGGGESSPDSRLEDMPASSSGYHFAFAESARFVDPPQAVLDHQERRGTPTQLVECVEEKNSVTSIPPSLRGVPHSGQLSGILSHPSLSTTSINTF